MDDGFKKQDSTTQEAVRASASVAEVDPEACRVIKPTDPCVIVIMGATGDLTARKLVPALFNLYLNDGLPTPFLVVGCGRTELSTPQFRDRMKNALGAINFSNHAKWPDFADALHYRSVDYEDPASFRELAVFLKDRDEKNSTRGNRIFYFALPPSLYKPAARMLGQAGLGNEGENNIGWSRLVVEKPFGRDLKTAIDLDQSIHEYFKEHQIYRIDHYLAKETVQNILTLRFANAIFEPVWDRRYIDLVKITATETLGVGHRAGYYEQTGVVRDMFQNHMMQLLALTAMEPPSRFEPDIVRGEKIKVFRSLRPFPVEELNAHIVLGQYGRGEIDEEEVPAYREENGVAPDSLTPTFAMMKVYVDNWRWQGVPFFITSGKRLAEKRTEIEIQFKEVPHSMFRKTLGDTIAANRLTMGIYPDERVTLTFQTKRPGARMCLRPVTMDFPYHQNYTGPVLEAYEKVLIDCMLGDQMLFWHQESVELCWSFLTPIVEACETCGDRTDMLKIYTAGSSGPAPDIF